MAGAQGERLAGDDVEEREPVARLDERLRAGHAHARPEAAVELDDDDAVEGGRGGRGVLGGRQVGGARDVARPVRCRGRRACPRLPRTSAVVGARERAHRLGRLAVGPHLLRRRAQSGAGHGLEQAGGGAGRDRDRIGRRARAGREQPEDRPAEAAADHARPGGAGGAQALDGAVDLGYGDLVVVAQARVRGVEERAEAREVARVERGDRLVDARVLGEHVADAPVERVREPGGGVRGGVAQRVDAQRVGRLRALPPARVVARPGVRVLDPGVDRDEAPTAEVAARQARPASVRMSRRMAWPSRPKSAASWSSRPVCAPTQSFSTREHSRARSRRSGSARPLWASSASARATSSAADEDSPLPRGTSPEMRSVAPARAWPARWSSATVPRTKARQPSAGSGSPTANVSVSPRSSACASMRPAGPSVASTVTPAAIANGRQSPSL